MEENLNSVPTPVPPVAAQTVDPTTITTNITEPNNSDSQAKK